MRAKRPKPSATLARSIHQRVEHDPVETRHQIDTAKGRLTYRARCEMLPLRAEDGRLEAGVFVTSYHLEGAGGPSTRPILFSFNGGPGSSSVWLHLGCVGPKVVQMQPEGGMPPPPFGLAENHHTWLTEADLVFIDPVGTGYSRAADAETAKKFYSVEGDIRAVGDIIRLFLTRYDRWTSPVYLVGESYGTTRAAGLSAHLVERGIALSGILLVSSILNFQTARFNVGNDLPYPLFLPTYTATAWYHRRLPEDLQDDLQTALAEAEAFAEGAYPAALALGDRLEAEDRAEITAKLSRLTGLSAEYIDAADLRIEIHKFCKELLRTDRKTVGRLDSRFTGIDRSAVTDEPEFDPSMSAIRPPYTAALNHYLRTQLNYRIDDEYQILGGLWQKWNWGSAGDGHPDTSDALREAMCRNEYMRVFIANGWYDLATPYFATRYTLAHMGLTPEQRSRITSADFPAGHMMYIQQSSLQLLKQVVSDWFLQA
jgi:carboxypeptidase C (cathepsin A)